MAGVTEKAVVRVQFSPDRLKAYLVFQPQADYSSLTTLDLQAALAPFHVRVDDALKERLAKVVEVARKGPMPSDPLLVAEGTPPVEPKNQEFVWDERYRPKNSPEEDAETINFYERHKLVTVEANTVIGTIAPAQPGRDGMDVCGNAVKPVKMPASIRLGENVQLEPDGKTVRAVASGQVIFQKQKLCVRRTLEINGNVDFETGNIDSATDVCIRGGVRDLFIVRSKRDIFVQNMVEAAYLFADGSITTIGGVEGRGKSILEAQGDITVKFLNFVYVQAGGDVSVCKEAIDSTIICNGWLDIANGSVISGQVFGLKGAEIKSAGSPAGVKTVIGVGLNPILYKEAVALDQTVQTKKDLVQKIRTSVAPLLQQLKRLTAEQKEKATELVCHADILEMEIKKHEEQRAALVASFPQPTEVELRIGGRILPNTQVFVADRFTTIHEEVRGPVKIAQRMIDGKRELLMINGITGSARTLMAGRLDADTLNITEKPKIAQPGTKAVQNN